MNHFLSNLEVHVDKPQVIDRRLNFVSTDFAWSVPKKLKKNLALNAWVGVGKYNNHKAPWTIAQGVRSCKEEKSESS